MEDTLVLPCDVTNQAEVDAAFEAVGKKYGKLDFLIHSIAFAPREALEGEFLATTREAFTTALDISAYSLAELSRAAAPLMTEGGSIISMTYYGAEKVVPNYNVMGVAKAALEASTRYLASDLGKHNIRVNAIAPGPTDTPLLWEQGDQSIIDRMIKSVPMKRVGKPEEQADAIVFLASDRSSFITGQTLSVSGGLTMSS